ncbi:hypothetical protein QBC37DRAFT_406761 [Rhypophila decipiens]|uniref:Uncharacterized protein n=1 Tax=Rhypophila decipiens TaxID=261697 RepID=A0AAN6XWH7_9PEZI|nr:hypothetical protein QBC37DRAFT_406761 [Rhypophila decipiens]
MWVCSGTGFTSTGRAFSTVGCSAATSSELQVMFELLTIVLPTPGLVPKRASSSFRRRIVHKFSVRFLGHLTSRKLVMLLMWRKRLVLDRIVSWHRRQVRLAVEVVGADEAVKAVAAEEVVYSLRTSGAGSGLMSAVSRPTERKSLRESVDASDRLLPVLCVIGTWYREAGNGRRIINIHQVEEGGGAWQSQSRNGEEDFERRRRMVSARSNRLRIGRCGACMTWCWWKQELRAVLSRQGFPITGGNRRRGFSTVVPAKEDWLTKRKSVAGADQQRIKRGDAPALGRGMMLAVFERRQAGGGS